MRRFAQVFVLAALATAGVVAGAVLAPGGSASPSAAVATTKVTVTATEFKFKLSRANVPTGTVVFTVVNRGKIAHDFKILGKKTPTIAPGKSAKLTVRFTKRGRFAYLCTLPGHARAGMKGGIQVGTTPVTVTATEFKFKLSRLSVPVGPVSFTVANKGKIAHDFKILGKKTPTLAPGKSFKLTVTFAKKGRYAFLCTLPGHAAAGMKGVFSVAAPPITAPSTTTTSPSTTTPPSTTTTTSGPEPLQGDPVAGKAVFAASGCASCHTLAAAGATGNVGPNLDVAKPTQAKVRLFVQNGSTSGGISMPAFASMSQTDLNNVAAFVYASTH
jgi:uncharacterized cupredoxin-like copper-binding protein/cytochrome c551/c552